MTAEKRAKRFVLFRSTRDLDDFRAFARAAAVLKAYGRVLIDVGTLADKAFHELPPGGSSWHEYAVNNPALIKVVPHPKLAPFVPADYVKRNHDLLTAKAAVLRRLGLEASFHCHEPYFVPEAFFREHPHLRGPRVDHPRRSRHEEFALCTDLPESIEMIEWMMAQLKRSVPELGTFFFNTNDAGSGFCWAAAQYAGPNGPRHCRMKTAGRRVREFIEALHRGAETGGGDVTVFIGSANFWHNEQHDVENHLPPNTCFARRTSTAFGIGSLLGENYPVRGMVNPLGIIGAMERFAETDVETVLVTFNAMYHRDGEGLETVEKVLEIAADCIETPAAGLRPRLEKLHHLSAQWAGAQDAEKLLEAFHDLDGALRLKSALVRWIPMYGADSLRHMTRPLVIRPELLSPEEESYFLPHIFNIHESEARTDYIDIHGSRLEAGSGGPDGIPALLGALDALRAAAETFESCRNAPAGEWLFHLATSLRIYVSAIRSTYNFYFAQLIRDRHAAELARQAPIVPEKTASWDGEGAILRWNELMRDELDNTTELIALLEERGLDQIGHAADERHQDCFVLGPNLIDDLRKKVRIMRDHWLDVEKYLAPPMK